MVTWVSDPRRTHHAVSKLSDYLNAHIPEGWSRMRFVEALNGRVDRATVYRYLAGQHVEQLYSSGRNGLAERLAASLATNSASQSVKRSSTEQPSRGLPAEAKLAVMPLS